MENEKYYCKRDRHPNPENMREKKIPSNRIICPAMAYINLSGALGEGCHEYRCCCHCPKKVKTTCRKLNGCKSRIFRGYPKICPAYPLTWKEAKTIWILGRIFVSAQEREDPFHNYSDYLKAVHQFMEEKKKENLRRNRVGEKEKK